MTIFWRKWDEVGEKRRSTSQSLINEVNGEKGGKNYYYYILTTTRTKLVHGWRKICVLFCNFSVCMSVCRVRAIKIRCPLWNRALIRYLFECKVSFPRSGSLTKGTLYSNCSSLKSTEHENQFFANFYILTDYQNKIQNEILGLFLSWWETNTCKKCWIVCDPFWGLIDGLILNIYSVK